MIVRSSRTSSLSVLLIGTESFDVRPGGLARYIRDLDRSLVNRGVDVQTVVLCAKPSSPDRSAARRATSALARLRDMHRSAESVADDIDVLDVHFALYGALPALVGSLRHKPLLVHFQGPWAAESETAGDPGLVVGVKRALERILYRRAAAVVVLSSAFGEILARDYGVDPARIHVIHPGVDLTTFSPGDRAAARSELGLAANTFVVVCARRLERRMGLDLLLRAWASVQTTVADSTLLIAGEGSQREELAKLVSHLPRPESVQLLGRVDDAQLIRLYRAADCTVVPSRALEGFGLVVLESLACGTPAVVTSVGGLPDGVADLDDSLVQPPDHVAIAKRLIAAAAGELPSRESCRSHAELFAWENVADSHIELLEAIAHRREGARERPRVAFLDHCAVLSGGELALARLLPALDVEAHVILAEDGPLRGRLEKAGATVHVLSLSDDVRQLRRQHVGIAALPEALRTGAYVLRLAHLLRKIRPDLVHTNSLKAALYGGVAGRLVGLPVIWHVRDRIADDYLPVSAVRLVKAAARVLPTAVIANSAGTLATLGRLRVPATSIPSPVDVVAGGQRTGDHPLRVGLVGRLAPWKGQDLFLRAFAQAFPNGETEAVLVGSALFGEQAFEDELKKLVASLGLGERIEFRGFRDDVGGELARVDVVVHASIVPEPFGQVVVEAMAAGKAVVVADKGGPAEVIDDDVTGLTYEMGDQQDLSRVLIRLAEDPVLRARLGLAAQSAAQRYRPDVVAGEVLAFYSRTLPAAGRSGARSGDLGAPAPRETGRDESVEVPEQATRIETL